MIIVKLKGGLGNQMFQYACGKALSIRNLSILRLDPTYFNLKLKGRTPRQYALTPFNISASALKENEKRTLQIISHSPILRRVVNWIGGNIPFIVKYVTERNYSPKINAHKETIYLDGYWQSEEYFKDFEEIIRKEFSLKTSMSESANVISEQINLAACPVSLHIRRGDYVTHPVYQQFYSLCDIRYYQKAIDIIKTKNFIIPHFFVFSDDIPWAKENLKTDLPITFVSDPAHLQDFEELILMSMCHHHIIANSSFSWWGAWLNPKNDKMVIAPKYWYSDPQNEPSNLIPPSWIRL